MRHLTVSHVEHFDATLPEADMRLAMDEEAFRALYDRTARPLWAYLARVTGDRHVADDLLQETYYRFLRAATVHEGEAHRRHALFAIATNLARDRQRRRFTRGIEVVVTEAHLQQGGDATSAQVERRADLARAMTRLRPRERMALWLAYAHGSSHKEIADLLGLRTGSIKPMLFRARRRLADLLGHARPASPGGSRE